MDRPRHDRGRREGRVPTDTHGPRAAKKHAAEPQVQPISGLPCAMALRLIRGRPRCTGLVSHRRPWDLNHRLSASVGAPGPHDFAVRSNNARLAHRLRPSHPASYVRDVRETPLTMETGWPRETWFYEKRKRNIFAHRRIADDALKSHVKFLVRRRRLQACLLDLHRPANPNGAGDLPDVSDGLQWRSR